MSRWSERIDAHVVTGILEAIATLGERVAAPADAAAAEDWARIPQVALALRRLVNETDSTLVSATTLDRLAAPLQNAASAVQSYETTENSGHLQSATTYLDQALDVVGMSAVRLRTKPAEVREAAELLRKSADEVVATLRGQVEEVEAAIGAVETRIKEVDRSRSQELESAEQRVAELTATVNAQKARLDTAITQFQEQFSAAEARRADTASQASKEQAAEFGTLQQRLSSEADAAIEELQGQAVEALEDIERQRERARTVVDTVGSIAFAGGYGKYADQQRGQANTWRWISAISLGGVVLLTGYYIVANAGTVLTWERLAERLLLVIPLVALAAYAAAQSGRHRTTERHARKLELELAAIDPYLSLFPEVERNAIKAELAKKLFGQPLEPAPPDGLSTDQVTKLIETAIGKK